MQRQDADRVGRRPLLSTFGGNNRQMLVSIRNNLSYLQPPRKDTTGDSGATTTGTSRAVDPRMQIKAELLLQEKAADLCQSSPNLANTAEKSNGGGKGALPNRLMYNQKALAEIRESLEGLQINESTSVSGTLLTNGYDDEPALINKYFLRQLMQMGYDKEVGTRALKLSGNKSVDAALEVIQRLNGFTKTSNSLSTFGLKVNRKPSFEDKYSTASSPGNSENSSCRSESPTTHCYHLDRQTPPPLPPRGVPPRVPQYGDQYQLYQQHVAVSPGHVQQMIRRMSPAQVQRESNSRMHGVPPGGMYSMPSQVGGGCQPVIMHSPQSVASQSQAHLVSSVLQGGSYSDGGNTYVMSGQGNAAHLYAQPPAYLQVVQETPGQSLSNGSHDPSSRVIGLCIEGHSPLSSHSPSPAPMSLPSQMLTEQSRAQTPKPMPVRAWGAVQPPIFMQQVKSREVQKPKLQTATAPPPVLPDNHMEQYAIDQQQPNYISSVHAQVNPPGGAPAGWGNGYGQAPGGQSMPVQIDITRRASTQSAYGGLSTSQLQSLAGQHPGRTIQIHIQPHGGSTAMQLRQQGVANPAGCAPMQGMPATYTPNSTPQSESPVPRTWNQSPMSVVSNTSTPSSNSDIPDKPPPPYPGRHTSSQQTRCQQQQQLQQQQLQQMQQQQQQLHHQHQLQLLQLQQHQVMERAAAAVTNCSIAIKTDKQFDQASETSDDVSVALEHEGSGEATNEQGKHMCTSPKPERRADARRKDAERCETQVRVFSPQAYKFYMEQHVENVLKTHHQRVTRRVQLQQEMTKVGLPDEAQQQLRKMLQVKESNYLRLKRAKLDKDMFKKIKTLGVGAFGEVALVRKRDTDHLYAMKTLRKDDVLQRNQVAHVKAERDILAEADNEWVVKLYYSFQDKDNLYFVMEYIPGGDLMNLLIKLGIFEEQLACFYIAELVLAIESVHKMGFIHRDIKPDNILIDKDGHIKLTDFGLCTGFRWTHNSKYYQKGNHMRQDSMDPNMNWDKELLKPLERRKLRHQRCLAHSLVGTPNYIAPEVLLRSGYTSSCDWWSVGVILYEMLVGQPPFLAQQPHETQLKVISWESSLRIPEEANLSPAAGNLIMRLCCGPEERLGCSGAQEVKEHPFFADINVAGLRQQTALHIPKIRHATDTSNFDSVNYDEPHDSASDDSSKKEPSGENGKHPEHAFLEFTFRRFFDDGGHFVASKMQDPETNSPIFV